MNANPFCKFERLVTHRFGDEFPTYIVFHCDSPEQASDLADVLNSVVFAFCNDKSPIFRRGVAKVSRKGKK